VTNDWAATGLTSVAQQVRELNASVEAVVSTLSHQGESVARLDDDVDRLIEERSETGAALSRHDRQLRELSAVVKRMATQVTWIEQHLRSSGAAGEVELGDVEPELAALAATAAAGHRAEDELLTAFARAGLEATIADHADAVTVHRRCVRSLLETCSRLAATDRDDEAHRKARADYLAVRTSLADAARRRGTLAGEVRPAIERLASDDDRRAERTPVVEAGRRAELELLTRLRTRLAAAVGDGAMLPAWLTHSLGPMPAAGTAQRWTEVGAGLLAYRITYRVDTPEEALGELPDTVTGYRRRWHAELGRGIRELRR
jgi:hypothetical protein